jgi:hypothetical protein
VPTAVWLPKLIAEPLPATGDPVADAPLNNWYSTPDSEFERPTATPVPPVQYAPPPVTLYCAIAAGWVIVYVLVAWQLLASVTVTV